MLYILLFTNNIIIIYSLRELLIFINELTIVIFKQELIYIGYNKKRSWTVERHIL